jgi:hypothetical protein
MKSIFGASIIVAVWGVGAVLVTLLSPAPSADHGS